MESQNGLKQKFFLSGITLLIIFSIFLGFDYYLSIPKEPLKIGFITDIQCYGKRNDDAGKWELNRRCKDPVDSFVKNSNNEFKPDVVIDGGDFIDGKDDASILTYKELKKEFNKIKSPKYFVLGNHEVDNFSKDVWLELTNQKSAYFYLEKDKYRIFVLDGNHYINNNEVLDSNPNYSSYSGLVDQEQIRWLEEMLKKSRKYQKIVFIHQPPIKNTTVKKREELLENYIELKEIFEKYKVKAVFSGHIEEFCYLKENGVSYYTIQGVHKNQEKLPHEHQFEDAGVFSNITIDKDNVEVKIFYKKDKNSPYDSFILNEETAICNNQSVKKVN